MWVKFWFTTSDASGLHTEDEYEWFEVHQNDEYLGDMARDIVPSWMIDSERGFSCGFERVIKPPVDVLKKKLRRYEHTKKTCDRMIDIINREIDE